jgi:hypothetical protein
VTAVYERLKALQITLPDVQPPVVDGYVAAFVPFGAHRESCLFGGTPRF